MKFIDTFMRMIESHGKYRTYALLRRMPEDQLRDVGISPELLAQGVKAWPWQGPMENDLIPASLRNVKLAKVKVEDVKQVAPLAAAATAEMENHQSAA